MTSRSVASVAMFAALIAAMGFLLAGIPNLELVSLLSFVAGVATGSARGATAGGIGMALYSSLNPYGAAPPPVFLAQILGAACLGFAGGRLAPVLRAARLARRAALLGAAGCGLTLVYDGLTNYGTAISIGAARDPWPVLIGGWAFGAFHVFWNTIFFVTLGPPLLRVAERVRERAA